MYHVTISGTEKLDLAAETVQRVFARLGLEVKVTLEPKSTYHEDNKRLSEHRMDLFLHLLRSNRGVPIPREFVAEHLECSASRAADLAALLRRRGYNVVGKKGRKNGGYLLVE